MLIYPLFSIGVLASQLGLDPDLGWRPQVLLFCPENSNGKQAAHPLQSFGDFCRFRVWPPQQAAGRLHILELPDYAVGCRTEVDPGGARRDGGLSKGAPRRAEEERTPSASSLRTHHNDVLLLPDKTLRGPNEQHKSVSFSTTRTALRQREE